MCNTCFLCQNCNTSVRMLKYIPHPNFMHDKKITMPIRRDNSNECTLFICSLPFLGIRLSIPQDDLVLCSVSVSTDATVEIDITGPSPFAVAQDTTKSSGGYQNILLFEEGGIQPSSSGLYTCIFIQNSIIVESETFQLDGTCKFAE